MIVFKKPANDPNGVYLPVSSPGLFEWNVCGEEGRDSASLWLLLLLYARADNRVSRGVRSHESESVRDPEHLYGVRHERQATLH